MPTSTSRLKVWLSLTIVIAFTACAAAGYMLWHNHRLQPKAGVDDVTVKDTPIFMALDPFTVSLCPVGEDTDRILYIGLTLRLTSQAAQQSVLKYLPENRSRLLIMLSQHTAADLATTEGKSQLIAQIKKMFNTPAGRQQSANVVSDVLFNTFILR